MDTISIHVPESVAATYFKADESKKKRAEQFISGWLQSFLSSPNAYEQLFQIMREATDLANKNGLTPEILEGLLNEGE
jgi:hypothetical protein